MNGAKAVIKRSARRLCVRMEHLLVADLMGNDFKSVLGDGRDACARCGLT